MRIQSAGFVRRWIGRQINIHPSLLPLFKGLHPHTQALEAGVKISGCTVHFVTEDMDCGPIIAQAAVPVHRAIPRPACPSEFLPRSTNSIPSPCNSLPPARRASKPAARSSRPPVSPGFANLASNFEVWLTRAHQTSRKFTLACAKLDSRRRAGANSPKQNQQFGLRAGRFTGSPGRTSASGSVVRGIGHCDNGPGLSACRRSPRNDCPSSPTSISWARNPLSGSSSRPSSRGRATR